MIQVRLFRFNELGTNCAVLWREGAKECVVADPGMRDGDETARLTDFLSGGGLVPEAILLTHGHFDHTWGVPALLAMRRVPVYMNPSDCDLLRLGVKLLYKRGAVPGEVPFETVAVHDGDTVAAAGISFRVLGTPGHSPGSVCYFCEEANLLLSGDTLFAGSIGRSDLPGGDYDDLIRSVMDRVMGLGGDVEVIPGHGPTTTIGREAMTNPFLIPFNEPEDDRWWEQDGISFER